MKKLITMTTGKKEEEERTIPETIKVVAKRNKHSLKSEGHQGTEQKDA